MGRCSFLAKWQRLHRPFKLLIFLLALLSALNDVVGGFDSDKSALLEFKASVSDIHGVLNNWDLRNPDHCSWDGVLCSWGSRVVALNFTGGGNSTSCARIAQFPLYGFGIRRRCLGSNSNIKLSGKLSAALANLSELRILSLPFNELSGEIPVEIWGMEKLEVLDLEGNSISGSLPVDFRGLKNLEILNLGFNEISGEIPSSLLNGVGLHILNLAGNQLKGSLPNFADGFRDLNGLYLSFNRLSGSIPKEIGDDCGKLEHLELSGNYFTDGIPEKLGNCRGLKTLLLYSNMLEGSIPPEIGELTQLEVLDVSRNNLGGPIPSELGNCTKLSVLVLSNSWNPLPSITSDEYNFYEGVIPGEVTSLPSLKMLWAPRTTFEGPIPSSWGSCKNLEMLNLAQNHHTGQILDSFSSCRNLHFLDLSSNRLGGIIDGRIPVPCMNLFDISRNCFSGSMPEFIHESCAPRIHYSYGGSLWPYDSSAVYISHFGYRSQIDRSLRHTENSESFFVLHNFASNNLTGPLSLMPIAPERLGKRIVYAFLAGQNKLTGSFHRSFFDKCNEAGGVMVNISHNNLSGKLPENLDAMCKSLMLLDASCNRISGTLAPTIGHLNSLVVFNLSWNLLQGSIPSSLGRIKNLRHLSLAGNNLHGSIPTSLGQLNSLEVLELSSNSLSGRIPPTIASTLSSLDVSFNNLSGPLPLSMKRNRIRCNSFLGNPLLRCPPEKLSSTRTDQLSWSPQAYSQNERAKSKNLNAIEITSVTSAAAIFSVLLGLILFFLYTRRRGPGLRPGRTSPHDSDLIVFSDVGAALSYEGIVRATGGFSASNRIGSGGFGATYKAEVAPGVVVAVKTLALGRFQGAQQFDAEVRTLGLLRHPNLVTLVGFHASESEMFLVYNYLSGGNLERFIQERAGQAVEWRALHGIALDVAQALAYLHDGCVPRVLHRDVKPSNILLDGECNAYLSDFGLARLLGTSETHATTGVAGTFGYVAPEYAMTCRVSDKADVYSYGVVLLELLSDKKALDSSFSQYGNGFNIVGWACMLLGQGRAREFFTGGLWETGPRDDLVEVLHLAVVCTMDSLSTRPSMKQVVRRLKQLQPGDGHHHHHHR